MSVPPAPLRAALAEAFGAEPGEAAPLGGGMINRAARVRIGGESVFVKWSAEAAPGHFAAEADGLRRLRAAGALRVPEVLAFCDRENGAPFLALEYIEQGRPQDAAAFARRFGEELAALHLAAPPDGSFGLDYDNWIGALPQPNAWNRRWPDFYRDCRLLPLINIARERGLLPPGRERLLMRVIERLDDLLGDAPSRPALLHGDLWAGNLLAAGPEPVVIDPAIYYGEREMELAYMQLFNGFGAATFAAYEAVYPLAEGYAHRRALHQLYPLLSHLNHFGEQYGADVERVCREYIA